MAVGAFCGVGANAGIENTMFSPEVPTLKEKLSNLNIRCELDDRDEKYEFTWNGKKESKKISQELSVNTLLPCKDKSKNPKILVFTICEKYL